MWRFFAKCFQIAPADHDSIQAHFMAWEKLRLLFNGVLALFSLIFMGIGTALIMSRPAGDYVPTPLMIVGRLLPMFLYGPVAVNVAFCVAPVAEGYLVLFRIERGMARGVTFTLGTMVGVGLAFLGIGGAYLLAI